MAIFEGIAAIAKDGLFLATRHYAFEFSLAGWGWVHLILGIVIVLAGCAVLSGALWARFFGVSVAGLGAIANFLWVSFVGRLGAPVRDAAPVAERGMESISWCPCDGSPPSKRLLDQAGLEPRPL
ncbi:hypothetical protein ABT050_05750 [Streptomyces mirabilis]